MKKLVFVFHLSSNASERISGSMLTRLDWLKFEARNRVVQARKLGIVEIEIFMVTGNRMKKVSIYGSLADRIDSLEAESNSASLRWDAIRTFLDKDTECLKDATMVVFADSEMEESRRYGLHDAEKILSCRHGLNIEVVEAPDKVSSGTLGIDFYPDPELKAPNVVDLIGCDQLILRTISNCVARAATFVRQRTCLHYEPVTTVLVDEATAARYRNVHLDSSKADDQLLYDLCEMLRLLQGTCLVFHKICPEGYAKSSPFDRNIAEYLPFQLSQLIDPFSSCRNSSELSHKITEILGGDCTLIKAVKYLLARVEDWFSEAAEQAWNSDLIEETSRYFENYGRFRVFGEKRTRFDQECWRRHYNGGLLEKLFDNDGYVHVSVECWYIFHSLTSRIVNRLLDDLPPSMMCALSSRLRLYGCYIYPPQEGVVVIQSLGGKEFVHNSIDSGIVLLALNECTELASQVAGPQSVDIERFREQLFCDILVHEHGHAAIREGMALHPLTADLKCSKIEGHTAEIEETIVEWLEFEAFRKNNLILKWIRQHASAGTFPKWPYAGALILEMLESRANLGREAMLKLLHLYRSGEAVAARALLDSWMRL